MFTLEEVAETLGIGYGALRDRLRALGGQLNPYLSRGKKGKILIDQNGLSVLRRMLELERSGMSIADCAQTVGKEMGLKQEEVDPELLFESTNRPQAASIDPTVMQLIEQLKAENEFLRSQINTKDDQLTRMQDLMQNRLTGEVSGQKVTEKDTVRYLLSLAEKQNQELAELKGIVERSRKPWWSRIRPSKQEAEKVA